MIDINKYESSISGIVSNLVYHKNYVPFPKKEDYDNGSITRYFAQKINTQEIYEISEDNFNEISDILYLKISLNWYISGPKTDIKNGNVVINRGVIEQNKESVYNAEKSIKGIKSYLTNYTEFYK